MNYVRPGDPLRIKASFNNALVDLLGQGGRTGSGAIKGALPDGCVLVRNDCGEDRKQFEILCLGEILYTPSDNEQAFRNQFVFKGLAVEWPTYIGKFAVLLEPLAEDKIGRAMVCGVIRTQLKVVNAAHRYADIEDDDEAEDQYRLKTNYSGGAAILYFEDQDEPTTTGDKWAIVVVGAFHNPTMVGRINTGEELVEDGEAEVRVQYDPGAWTDGDAGELVDVTDYKLAPGRKLPAETRVEFSMDRDSGKFVVRGWKGCSVEA